MNLFKILGFIIFTLNFCESFPGLSEDIRSSENRIKDAVEKTLTSDKNISDLCFFLDKEISETLLELEIESASAEKESYNKFIWENVTNNKTLNTLILKTSLNDLNSWQNRVLDKFLPEKVTLSPGLDKETFRKVKLIKKDRFLFLKGENNCTEELDNITLLNYNYLAFKGSEEATALIENILSKNPDLICLEGVFLNTDAKFLYDQLKENYTYFYVDINSDSTNLNSGLFVASKYAIAEPQVHFFDELTCFDFFVMNNQKDPIAQIYLFDLQLLDKDSSTVERFIQRVSNENLKSSVPVLLCGNLKEEQQTKSTNFTWLLQDCLGINETMIKFKSELFGFKGNAGVISKVKNLLYKENNSNYIENHDLQIQLCGDKKDGAHGKVGISVEEKNKKKEASAHGELSYSKTTSSGATVSASVEGKVEVDDKGKTSQSVKGSVEIGFKK